MPSLGRKLNRIPMWSVGEVTSYLNLVTTLKILHVSEVVYNTFRMNSSQKRLDAFLVRCTFLLQDSVLLSVRFCYRILPSFQGKFSVEKQVLQPSQSHITDRQLAKNRLINNCQTSLLSCGTHLFVTSKQTITYLEWKLPLSHGNNSTIRSDLVVAESKCRPGFWIQRVSWDNQGLPLHAHRTIALNGVSLSAKVWITSYCSWGVCPVFDSHHKNWTEKEMCCVLWNAKAFEGLSYYS